MDNTYNCKQCGKGLLTGQVCNCFLKNAGIERVDMEPTEKENLVELAKRYNITGFATALKVVESLSQENIRLSEENKLLKSDLENDTNDYWLKKVFELESENKKLSEGLTIAYMSGVADEKERSRAEVKSLNEGMELKCKIAFQAGMVREYAEQFGKIPIEAQDWEEWKLNNLGDKQQ